MTHSSLSRMKPLIRQVDCLAAVHSRGHNRPFAACGKIRPGADIRLIKILPSSQPPFDGLLLANKKVRDGSTLARGVEVRRPSRRVLRQVCPGMRQGKHKLAKNDIPSICPWQNVQRVHRVGADGNKCARIRCLEKRLKMHEGADWQCTPHASFPYRLAMNHLGQREVGPSSHLMPVEKDARPAKC